MRNRRLPALLVMLLALVATACATSQNVSSGTQLSVQFQVDNNVRDISGTTVYVVGETGSRRSLGSVEPNRRATFDRSLRAGSYQLIATRVGQTDLVSEQFRLDTDGMIVMWNMNVNQLTFAQK